jgi:hypothetical protein
MPATSFSSLPAEARVWVFASGRPLSAPEAGTLLAGIDAYLAEWQAHGAPLRCAREWRDNRFLAIGVDPTAEQASGCSIDGMFRRVRELEQTIGARLVGGGRIFYRDPGGAIQVTTNTEFSALAVGGRVSSETPVFDTTVTTARDWRDRFTRRAGEGWTADLLAVS